MVTMKAMTNSNCEMQVRRLPAEQQESAFQPLEEPSQIISGVWMTVGKISNKTSSASIRATQCVLHVLTSFLDGICFLSSS